MKKRTWQLLLLSFTLSLLLASCSTADKSLGYTEQEYFQPSASLNILKEQKQNAEPTQAIIQPQPAIASITETDVATQKGIQYFSFKRQTAEKIRSLKEANDRKIIVVCSRIAERKNTAVSRQEPEKPVEGAPKIEGLGLAGFICSLVGLIVLGIPLGILAVIFGAVSLSKITKNPSKWKGRGFAIASLIIGIVDIIAVLILLSMMA